MWIKGRQDTQYYKFKLFEFKLGSLGFDGYILKYPKDSYIPPHKDPVTDKRHYRLNLIWPFGFKGGKFESDKSIVSIKDILYLFRPDLSTHSLSPVSRGTRYVLSLGFAH